MKPIASRIGRGWIIFSGLLAGLGLWYIAAGWRWTYLGSTVDADNLAEKLVSQNRTAHDCKKSFQLFPTYPPLSELQALCIRRYAHLLSDAGACDLLMPSDYGKDCIRQT